MRYAVALDKLRGANEAQVHVTAKVMKSIRVIGIGVIAVTPAHGYVASVGLPERLQLSSVVEWLQLGSHVVP